MGPKEVLSRDVHVCPPFPLPTKQTDAGPGPEVGAGGGGTLGSSRRGAGRPCRGSGAPGARKGGGGGRGRSGSGALATYPGHEPGRPPVALSCWASGSVCAQPVLCLARPLPLLERDDPDPGPECSRRNCTFRALGVFP